jgi:cell division protein FtsB
MDLTWFVTEFAFILLILFNRYLGVRGRWHDRALDYRILAELLRQGGFLLALGRTTPFSRPPLHSTRRGEIHWTWVNWHFRAIVRDVGMPPLRLTTEHLTSCRRFFGEQWIGEQRRYHDRNARLLHGMDENLHAWVRRLFVLTLIACAGHIAAHSLHLSTSVAAFFSSLSRWLTLIAAAAPAWAAALHGIAAQAELATLSDRSDAMERTLAGMQEHITDLGTAKGKPLEPALASEARHVAEILLREVLDWRTVYQAHEIPLS